MTRPTIDERMDLWLNQQADTNQIPDTERQRFIDAMRGTFVYATTRFGYAWDDLVDEIAATRFGRFQLWVTGYRNRIPRSQRKTHR